MHLTFYEYYCRIIIYSVEKTGAFTFYKEAECKSQIWTKWPLIVFCTAEMTAVILPSFIHSVINMWHGNFDTSTWFLLTKWALPFDTSNIFVWYGLLVSEAFMATTFIFIFTSIITYFMSCSFYIDACGQHFRFSYRQLEEKIDENPRKTYENTSQIKRKLGNAVCLHVKIIKLVRKNLNFNIYNSID